MKLNYIIGATALSLLLAGAAYPQQEQEKEKPAQQEEKPAEKPKEQPKKTPKQQPAEKHQQDQQKQDDHAAKQQEQGKEQQEQGKQQQQTEKRQQDQQKQMTKQQQDEQKQQQRQQQQVARQQHQTDQQQHSDRDHGRRIPDDRFRASFGREHTFRVERRDDRRFQFGGFWFTYSEPWPVEWAYTDDVYVDYIDGEYYLIDLRHPGVRLLLVVD